RRDQWDSTRPLLPWLSAISRYKIIDALRRRRTELRLRIHLSEAQWLDLLQHECSLPLRGEDTVEQKVAGLPPVEQAVMRKMGLEGLTSRQTALATGMK